MKLAPLSGIREEDDMEIATPILAGIPGDGLSTIIGIFVMWLAYRAWRHGKKVTKEFLDAIGEGKRD